MCNDLVFLKLGGSLITDKTQTESIRPKILARIAAEIASARRENPHLRLVLGHGSGSFGHVPAAKFGTREGVESTEQWRGFIKVAAAASRLNTLVVDALLAANVPVISLTSRGSAAVSDGTITYINHQTIENALDAGLVPLVMGDVAFDAVRGGTIISTEEIFAYLTPKLNPKWLLFAGEVHGVHDEARHLIPQISHANLPHIREALGASRGTDVTGGMLSKVLGMLQLSQRFPSLSIQIFSGLQANNVQLLLASPARPIGTRIVN